MDTPGPPGGCAPRPPPWARCPRRRSSGGRTGRRPCTSSITSGPPGGAPGECHRGVPEQALCCALLYFTILYCAMLYRQGNESPRASKSTVARYCFDLEHICTVLSGSDGEVVRYQCCWMLWRVQRHVSTSVSSEGLVQLADVRLVLEHLEDRVLPPHVLNVRLATAHPPHAPIY